MIQNNMLFFTVLPAKSDSDVMFGNNVIRDLKSILVY